MLYQTLSYAHLELTNTLLLLLCDSIPWISQMGKVLSRKCILLCCCILQLSMKVPILSLILYWFMFLKAWSLVFFCMFVWFWYVCVRVFFWGSGGVSSTNSSCYSIKVQPQERYPSLMICICEFSFCENSWREYLQYIFWPLVLHFKSNLINISGKEGITPRWMVYVKVSNNTLTRLETSGSSK